MAAPLLSRSVMRLAFFALLLLLILVGSSSSSSLASRPQRDGVLVFQRLEMPHIIYGTAWKREKTKELVFRALKAGYRAIDTACQPKHYHEGGVGEGLSEFIHNHSGVSRSNIFLQSKFTPAGGQDLSTVPYDVFSSLSVQVEQSMTTTLQNLQTHYLDALLLHSPLPTFNDTLEVWRAFEKLYYAGKVRYIGVSNFYDTEDLLNLYENANIKPAIIQNRFYSKSNFDKGIRKMCLHFGIKYQSFWSLTANSKLLYSDIVQRLARKYSMTCPQIFFSFLMSQGIHPLTGTSSEEHMHDDLAAHDTLLTIQDIDAIQQLFLNF